MFDKTDLVSDNNTEDINNTNDRQLLEDLLMEQQEQM